MSQPTAEGLFSFIQYMYPLVFPGERFERTPMIEAIAAAVVERCR